MDDIRLHWLDAHLIEPTRKARRNLLLSSGISLLLIKGQLVPTKISALGISIEQIQRETIFQALIAVTVYYFLKFYIYAFLDGEKQSYLAKKIVLGAKLPENYKDIDKAYRSERKGKHEEVGIRIFIWALLRIGIDFTIPLIIGIYAIYHLIKAF